MRVRPAISDEGIADRDSYPLPSPLSLPLSCPKNIGNRTGKPSFGDNPEVISFRTEKIDNPWNSKWSPRDNTLYVKAPHTVEELFIALHELGHVVVQAHDPMPDDPFERVKVEAKAWGHAFKCVREKYREKLLSLALHCLGSYNAQICMIYGDGEEYTEEELKNLIEEV